MLKPLFFIFFLLLSLPGFSQGEIRKTPLSPGGGHVTIRPSTQSEQPPVTETPLNSHDDEALVEEALADREKQLEKIKQVQEPLNLGADEATNAEVKPETSKDELKKLGYDSLTPRALLDERVLALVQKQLNESSLSKLSDQEVKLLILEKTKDSFWGRTFGKFPKLLDTGADIVRDPEALPGLVGILVRKKDLKDYGYIWVVVFIFSLFIKSRINQSSWGFGRRFFIKATVSLSLTFITLYIFYTFFKAELTPTLKLIGKNFF